MSRAGQRIYELTRDLGNARRHIEDLQREVGKRKEDEAALVEEVERLREESGKLRRGVLRLWCRWDGTLEALDPQGYEQRKAKAN